MAVAVDSLWSPDIKPTTQSPRSILDVQARAISQQTNGLLVGEVRASRDELSNSVYLNLDIVVPALHNYRQRILTATHALATIYPVRVDSELLTPFLFEKPRERMGQIITSTEANANLASSDEQFRNLVGQVLRSHPVTSLAQSLIAQANDVLSARDAIVKLVLRGCEIVRRSLQDWHWLR